MNKTVAIIVFSSLFFLALTFILLYVQLYDDYVAAINGGRGYIVFLMVMAALSLLILVLIGGWLFWDDEEENPDEKEIIGRHGRNGNG